MQKRKGNGDRKVGGDGGSGWLVEEEDDEEKEDEEEEDDEEEVMANLQCILCIPKSISKKRVKPLVHLHMVDPPARHLSVNPLLLDSLASSSIPSSILTSRQGRLTLLLPSKSMICRLLPEQGRGDIPTDEQAFIKT